WEAAPPALSGQCVEYRRSGDPGGEPCRGGVAWEIVCWLARRTADSGVTPMATFAYEAMNSSGQEVKDEIDANDSAEAIAKIRGKGLFPTKVREKAGKKRVGKKKEDQSLTPKRKMPIAIGGVARKQLVSFTR